MPLSDKKSFRTRRSRKRQQRRYIFRTGLTALAFVLLCVGVGFAVRLDAVTLTTIAVEGGETVSHDVVRERAESALSGTYALLIPKKFAYLFPHDAVVQEVLGVPRVSGVSVTRVSRTELRITFTEYVPHALWCAGENTVPCVFVNEDGYGFAEAPALTGGALLRLVNEVEPPRVGTNVFPEEIMETIVRFADALASQHDLRIRAVTATKDEDLIFHIAQGGDLLVSRGADIQDVFDNLASVLSSEEFKNLDIADIDYIDLRFGNKVYLKEVEEEASPVVASSTSE